ncbi:helix-turn-helix domain-containing protein [Levilactobacillus suantsaiihabitans]|uniref:AraC family transcriptional regulator n=1 Tax=Levilactobacillus suantsaiihabitans TaxID=2487722 RepID=A0A4Z0J6S2_9LACO|nr:AraC family transcriptional regulator [Levilactobacillus suantsaiihabitans]TGD17620.1 AraC family transcriptional regulator [Levilactobacillus suantsaiihabitans]
MKPFVPIPVVDSSLYLFGGHQRTVPGGWQFFEQKHQAFELMCVVEGRQTTEIKGNGAFDYGAGEVMIISPGTLHTNKNTSETASMTYICFHFSIESLELKSELLSSLVNAVIPANHPVAQAAMTAATTIVAASADRSLTKEQANLRIQIAVLTFFYAISTNLQAFTQRKTGHYSESEAKTSRQMASLIKQYILKKEIPAFSFATICQQVGVSSGYGHRIFKKVYGVTPLHYIESQKYNKAKRLLGSPEYSIEDIAYLMGASSVSNFSKQFKKWSGITPSRYQRQLKQKRRVRTVKESGYFE